MNEDDIAAEIVRIVRATLENPTLPITPATTARDVPGWDSVKMVEIILQIEERFAVRLKAREVDRLRNVGDLIAAVRGHLA